jgi:hypothetical protein
LKLCASEKEVSTSLKFRELLTSCFNCKFLTLIICKSLFNEFCEVQLVCLHFHKIETSAEAGGVDIKLKNGR